MKSVYKIGGMPESIANVQIEIQIVDTHETPVVIGLQAL